MISKDYHVITTENNSLPEILCPCTGQPEGLIISHPTDCRAYYTCLDDTSVRYSRCGVGDQFFHPYLRVCVQRSKYLFFIPKIVQTKDLCKVNSIFRAPAAENFDGCGITSDEVGNSELESEEEQEILANGVFNVDTSVEMLPETLAEETSNSGSSNLPVSRNDSSIMSQSQVGRSRPNIDPVSQQDPGQVTATPNNEENFCKVDKITVDHFPGPCRAAITCENGMRLGLSCHNTLSFV